MVIYLSDFVGKQMLLKVDFPKVLMINILALSKILSPEFVMSIFT